MAKIPVTGGVGGVPPAGAPYEVTQPGSERATPEQIAQAQANERQLAPLVFAPTMPVPTVTVATTIVSAADAVNAQSRIRKVTRSRPEPEGGESVPAQAGPPREPTGIVGPGGIILTDVDATRPGGQPSGQPFQPAASDTESPSRGQPKSIADPGKQITGGFGDVGEAQYFPLDGSELRTLIRALMDSLDARLDDDLRFSMAICYPRVSARVVIEVNAFVNDQSFEIPKVMLPWQKTPIAVARAHGDEVVFCVVAERVEMSDSGESITPPNQTRIDLGLAVPRKQAIQTPTGRQMVDIPATSPTT